MALARRWMQFRLRWLLLLPLLVGGLLAVSYYWPKKMIWLDQREVTGYYHGLGLHDGTGFLGKDFYRVEVSRDNTFLVSELSGSEYSPYRMYYPDGQMAAEGECLVNGNGQNRPMIDESEVRWGRFYRPDGTLDGEIRDGTGVQRFWTPTGVKVWELHLQDGKRTELSMWYPNGQLSTSVLYVDNEEDGERLSFYESGAVSFRGENFRGKAVGTWTWYNEDGTIHKEVTYEDDQ